MDILNLKPERVWKHFYSITQIPRPSKKEDKIRAFLVSYGKSLGLETIADQTGNVIIRKPATPGMENRKGVILQAHMDMVPQKNNATVHDFEKDPIKPRIEGDWVYATGTTLGADNGMGIAAAMAVLEAKDLKHGPVEVLITTDEETGMTGARGLQSGLLEGSVLLNMDSEDEGELYVGCAGGEDGSFEMEYTPEPVPGGMQAWRVNLTGLKGGHSGMDINLGRGNALPIHPMKGVTCLPYRNSGICWWKRSGILNKNLPDLRKCLSLQPLKILIKYHYVKTVRNRFHFNSRFV